MRLFNVSVRKTVPHNLKATDACLDESPSKVLLEVPWIHVEIEPLRLQEELRREVDPLVI